MIELTKKNSYTECKENAVSLVKRKSSDGGLMMVKDKVVRDDIGTGKRSPGKKKKKKKDFPKIKPIKLKSIGENSAVDTVKESPRPLSPQGDSQAQQDDTDLADTSKSSSTEQNCSDDDTSTQEKSLVESPRSPRSLESPREPPESPKEQVSIEEQQQAALDALLNYLAKRVETENALSLLPNDLALSVHVSIKLALSLSLSLSLSFGMGSKN